MNLLKLSDKELIQLYTSGSEAAIEVLINRYQQKVLTFILFKVKDRDLAEDIFQDTFIKVINTFKRRKYNEEGKFLPWVYRIAHNLIIDYYRKNAKMKMITGDAEFDIFDVISSKEKPVDVKMDTKQSYKEIKKLIQYLPNDQKEVLMMRLYYDMSFKEIADFTNVSINTALGRMRYALINMRKMAEEKNIPISLH